MSKRKTKEQLSLGYKNMYTPHITIIKHFCMRLLNPKTILSLGKCGIASGLSAVHNLVCRNSFSGRTGAGNWLLASVLLSAMLSPVHAQRTRTPAPLPAGQSATPIEQYILSFNRSSSRLLIASGAQAGAADSNGLKKRIVPQLTLKEAVTVSRDYSTQLSIENSKLLQSEYQREVNFGGLLPKLDVRGAVGKEKSAPASKTDATGKSLDSDTHTRSDTSVVLTQSLFDWGVLSQWRQQGQISDAARLDFDAQLENHIMDVVNTYMSLIQSRLVLNLTREFDEQIDGLMRYVRSRASAGVTSQADEDRVRGKAQNIKASLIEVQGQFEASLITFKRMTGIVPESIEIPSPFIPPVIVSLKDANARALERNADIAAGEKRLQAADIGKSVAFSRHIPKIELQVSDTRTANPGGAEFTQVTQSAMVVANWNLLNGGADYYQSRMAAERYSELSFQQQENSRKILESLELTLSAYASSLGRIEAANREQVANLSVMRAYINQLQTGARSISDMLDAYQRLYQSRTEVVKLTIARARLAYQAARLTGDLRGYFQF